MAIVFKWPDLLRVPEAGFCQRDACGKMVLDDHTLAGRDHGFRREDS
jgi:hypothetical protein